MASLRRSNVTTYVIDPRGHVSPQDLALESFPRRPACSPRSRDAVPTTTRRSLEHPVRMAQDGLGLLAEASGGFAITDTDDFAGGLARVIEDLDHYYLLGFYPADPNGKDYRPLDVKVAGHPEWTLRFRKSYLPGGPPPLPKGADPLLAGVMPKTDLASAADGHAISRDARLEQEHARHARARDHRAGDRAAAGQWDAAGRPDVSGDGHRREEEESGVTRWPRGQARPQAAPGRRLRAGHRGVPDQHVDRPAPGRYQLRASASSARLTKGGSVYLMLDVPDFAASPLSLSGLLIGYADGAHVAVAPAPAPAPPSQVALSRGGLAPADAALLFAPSLDREFLRSDTLRLYFEVVRTTSMAAHVTVDMIDAQGRAAVSLGRDIPANANGRADLTMPLGPLAPGPTRCA